MAWVVYKKGQPIPAAAVRCVQGDFELCVARSADEEVGKLEIIGGKLAGDLFCHHAGKKDAGEVLVLSSGSEAVWEPYAKLDPIPAEAFYAGKYAKDGFCYVGRSAEQEIGKMTVKDGGRMNNLWCSSSTWTPITSGEVLVIRGLESAAQASPEQQPQCSRIVSGKFSRPGRIEVVVKSGKGLYVGEFVVSEAPFCKIKLGRNGMPGDAAETKVLINCGRNPVWRGTDGARTLEWRGEDKLFISILNKDGSSESNIGVVALNVPVLARLGSVEDEFPVFRQGTDREGTLSVAIACSDVVFEQDGGLQLVQTIPVKMHRNVFQAQLMSALEGDTASAFVTYETVLQRITKIWGDRWNDNYDESHAKLFADDAQGRAIRTVMRAEHAAIYGDGILPHWLRVQGKRDLKEYISTADDLLKLLRAGERRDTVRRVYTYVIVDSGLFFSETGAMMAKDVFSKHAVHANAEAKVRFAGTFRICTDEAGRPVMVIDNDSGTYRPSGSDLPRLKETMEVNFPGLQVECLDVCDPQPEHTKAWSGPMEDRDKPGAVYAGQWVWRFGGGHIDLCAEVEDGENFELG